MNDNINDVIEKATYLAALGSPIKPRRDFERLQKRALTDLQMALAKMLNPEAAQEYSPMTQEEKDAGKAIAESFAIRPIWLVDKL